MFALCAFLIIRLLLATNYQLGWNSHLVVALLLMFIIWFVLVHLTAVCKVVIPKKGTATTKG